MMLIINSLNYTNNKMCIQKLNIYNFNSTWVAVHKHMGTRAAFNHIFDTPNLIINLLNLVQMGQSVVNMLLPHFYQKIISFLIPNGHHGHKIL